MSSLTLAQQRALAITPKVTSCLSMPCSLFIILESIRDHRRSRGSAVQRALVGMSCVDILASSGWFLSTWAVPRGTIAYAVGNQATCNYQGFLLQLAIGAPLYNCSLALYYLLIIKYGWTDEKLDRIERWIHFLVISFSVGTSILLLPLKQYNQIEHVCWIIGSPVGCGHSSHVESSVPCDRGNWAWLYGILLFYGPLWLCVVLTVFAMISIYRRVRKIHSRMGTYLASTLEGTSEQVVSQTRVVSQNRAGRQRNVSARKRAGVERSAPVGTQRCAATTEARHRPMCRCRT